ncbi:hypothetical protein FRC12_017903 [Ceratobasidium sp. 428]|nr:hypothetical protein FRC12_017903 [Ceratobasidium sp. 428]
MLQVTGQLIVLHLTFGFIKPNLIELDLRMPKIKLHHLRELGLLFVKEAFWALNFVMGLEAPDVDFLQIGLAECETGSKRFVEYLADGGQQIHPSTGLPLCHSLENLAWSDQADNTVGNPPTCTPPNYSTRDRIRPT